MTCSLNIYKKTTPTNIEFIDIAGLVSGSVGGEGLGNRFLAYIREADAIIHTIRCFENENVIHVGNKIDPLSDDGDVVEFRFNV